jgi:hypothetical protein
MILNNALLIVRGQWRYIQPSRPIPSMMVSKRYIFYVFLSFQTPSGQSNIETRESQKTPMINDAQFGGCDNYRVDQGILTFGFGYRSRFSLQSHTGLNIIVILLRMPGVLLSCNNKRA